MTQSQSAHQRPISAALDKLFSPVNHSDAPGVMVGVSYRGRIIYRRGFGLASVEHGVANTPTTRSRIGSTSKHFTCLAILLLAEEGKLRIDSSVREWFPEVPILEGEATLRQLMTHTSGYRCFLSTQFIGNGMAIRPPGTVVQSLARQKDVNFAPGERMMYNNSGCHLLSRLVERVSGVPFAQFLKERIFEPMGMVDTLSLPSDLDIVPGMATLHLQQPGAPRRRGLFPMEDLLGEGSVVSTVDDMLLWLSHMRGTKIVGSEFTWTEMTALARLNSGRVLNYGLGLLRHDYRGVEVVYHPGGVIGGNSQMLTVPEHALDIVVLANSDSIDSIELTNGVIDVVLADVLGAQPSQVDASNYKPLLGRRYFSPERTGYEFSFAEVGGKLGLGVIHGPAVPLKVAADRFRLEPLDNRGGGPYEFVLPSSLSEAPATLSMSDGGEPLTFQLLPETVPDTLDVGAELIGRWRCADLGAIAEIATEGDKLVLTMHGEFGINIMDLEALSNDLLGWRPRGGVPEIGTLHLQRDSSGVRRLLLDSFRTRHLLLERIGG